jgi:hypothetical protein
VTDKYIPRSIDIIHPFMVRSEIVVIIGSIGMAACGSDKVLYLLSEGLGNVGYGDFGSTDVSSSFSLATIDIAKAKVLLGYSLQKVHILRSTISAS